MIYLTGDTHGTIDIHKLSTTDWPSQDLLTKEDYLVILGDFGLIWDQKETEKEKYWLDWLNKKSFTTLFIDGNHENFDRLFKYPEINMFGDKVGKISESVFHLKRGKVYNIDNKKIFTFGGGLSVDKNYRIPGISWWPQEYPSQKEIDHGLDNLSKINWKVDYVFTHTGPKSIFNKVLQNPKFESIIPPHNQHKIRDSVSELFDQLLPMIEFKYWYMAHYHIDITIDSKFKVLYNNILKIDN